MKKLLLTLLILGLVGTFLTIKMKKLAQAECSLCLSFNTRRDCATGLGPNQKDAIEAAHSTLCARLAGGVTETLACNRVEAEEIQCKGH